MNFNVYLDDDLVRRLAAIAKREGTSRNALIRQAVESWVSHSRVAWPALVLEWAGDPSAAPFEDRRAELAAPVDDPFAPPPRRPGRSVRPSRRVRPTRR